MWRGSKERDNGCASLHDADKFCCRTLKSTLEQPMKMGTSQFFRFMGKTINILYLKRKQQGFIQNERWIKKSMTAKQKPENDINHITCYHCGSKIIIQRNAQAKLNQAICTLQLQVRTRKKVRAMQLNIFFIRWAWTLVQVGCNLITKVQWIPNRHSHCWTAHNITKLYKHWLWWRN